LCLDVFGEVGFLPGRVRRGRFSVVTCPARSGFDGTCSAKSA